MSTLTESESTRQRLEEELKTAHESSHAEVCNLMDRLDAKTRAGEYVFQFNILVSFVSSFVCLFVC